MVHAVPLPIVGLHSPAAFQRVQQRFGTRPRTAAPSPPFPRSAGRIRTAAAAGRLRGHPAGREDGAAVTARPGRGREGVARVRGWERGRKVRSGRGRGGGKKKRKQNQTTKL